MFVMDLSGVTRPGKSVDRNRIAFLDLAVRLKSSVVSGPPQRKRRCRPLTMEDNSAFANNPLPPGLA